MSFCQLYFFVFCFLFSLIARKHVHYCNFETLIKRQYYVYVLLTGESNTSCILSGPIIALALAAQKESIDVVTQWRILIGPKDVTIAKEEAPESLRAQFGSSGEDFKNALHGSDTSDVAAR